MSTDAAGGGGDSAVAGNAEPPQDVVQVAGLLLARGPRVLVNGKEHLGMAEEQVFGPVGRGHWLAMRLALFGGVAVPHGGALRFPERLYDSLRILFADPRSQLVHVGSPIDFVIRLGTDLVHPPIGGYEEERAGKRLVGE